MFCCLHDFGSVPYIVPLMDLGKLALRVLQTKKSIFCSNKIKKVNVEFFLSSKIMIP